MGKRSIHQEQLDNFELDGPELHKTLSSLAWINRWFGNNRSMFTPVFSLIKKKPQKTYTIIDLGCGGGDLIRYLDKAFQKHSININWIGIDANENSLNYARSLSLNSSNIDYLKADILAQGFKLPNCDILISSHFLYHFKDQDLAQFFNQQLSNIKLGFINSGLENHGIALGLFKYFSFLLPINKMAKTDGLQAIQSAFTKQELSAVAQEIRNVQFKVRRVPFFRLLLRLECQ